MDFTYDDDQLAVIDLAREVFAGHCDDERIARIEAGAERFDRALWTDLAGSGLLAVALPREDGGAGLTGFALLLREQGRHLAHVPLLPTIASGVLPLERFGTAAHRAELVAPALDGALVLTGSFPAGAPWFTATPDGDGYVLRGTDPLVAAAPLAGAVLVTAELPGGEPVVAVVDPRGPHARVDPVQVTNRAVDGRLTLDGVRVGPADVIGRAGAAAWTGSLARLGAAAIQWGVCEEALRRTARYTSEREQFGRALSTNQAVATRAADAYIDTEAIRLTVLEAAWRIDAGLDAAREIQIAAWWASEAGQRVVHTTQHLHGGTGADAGYPIHRYFLWGRQLEVLLGGAAPRLAELGRLLTAPGPAGHCPPSVPVPEE